MVWPFSSRRQRSSAPLDRKPMTTPALPLPEKTRGARKSESKSSMRSAGQHALRDLEKSEEHAPSDEKALMKKERDRLGKENVKAAAKTSREDITALPISFTLQQSPHLRAADASKPQIPYNFRDHATSLPNVQHDAHKARPTTLKSKRSTYEATPQRRSSKKRKGDDRVREEEIRAMSAATPSSKRQGDGMIRRDSYKRRNLAGMLDSNVSLPAENSIHSAMSGGAALRDWEIGGFAAFVPRPPIRLSGAAQYASPLSKHLRSPLSKDESMRLKDKRPISRDSTRKRIGEQADELDSSDLRVLLERDAKRREARKKEQQEKLDRRLRSRAGRDRSDSTKKKEAKDINEVRRAQSTRQRVEEETRARGLIAAPTAVHPALRDEPVFSDNEAVGLGIGEAETAALISPPEPLLLTTEELGTQNSGTLLDYGVANPTVENPFEPAAENPFADPALQPTEELDDKAMRLDVPINLSPVMTPMEDPVLGIAREMRMAYTITPPISPLISRETTVTPILSREKRLDQKSSSPEPPPISASPKERPTSDQRERRAGAWATFFRRGGTKLDEASPSGSSSSFQNTSRDSMSRGPIPAHLIGKESTPFQRRKSGTPTRTQSKFREDLPELPISPPDSRVQSPEVPDLPTGAAAIAAARRRLESKPSKPSDMGDSLLAQSDNDHSLATRYDTPVGVTRAHRAPISASLASVDSEGSWLASGGSLKRSSTPAGLSRDLGSLSKRRADFSSSYEELGVDNDAEYVRRKTPSSDLARHVSISRDPPAVKGTVQRTPTIVQRTMGARSREGLLTEFTAGEPENSPLSSDDDGDDEVPDSPVGELGLQSARSVHVHGGRGHVRQVSAGSAKLLNVQPPSRRTSMSPPGRE